MKKQSSKAPKKAKKASKINPIDSFKGKFEKCETVPMTFLKPITLKSPSGERVITLESGEYDFLRIPSRHPHLNSKEKKLCAYLALKSEIVERQLIFGKLESTFLTYELPA